MARSVSIAVTGDLFPNDRFYVDGRPIDSGLDSTLAVMGKADIRHATFLMPLSERGEAMEKVAVIRAHPAIAEDLPNLGLNLISLANNHSFDFGPDALSDTIRALTGAGSQIIGAGVDIDAATKPVILTENGVRVGFVAFSCLVPPGAAATAERPGIAAIRVHSSYEVHPAWSVEEPGEPELVQIHTRVDADDEARALEQVRAVRQDVDILIVTVHWGFGAGERLAEYQQPLAHAFVDAGADAVFGHHVHGVQGVEIYQGSPIFYSPGTFIGRQESEDPATLSELAQRLIADMTPDGYIAILEFTDEKLASLALTPTTHSERGIPHVSEGEEFDRVAGRIIRGSSKLGTKMTAEGRELVVDLG